MMGIKRPSNIGRGANAPPEHLKKNYSKYCRKCALAKYNIISEIVKLFGLEPRPLREVDFKCLTELRKALEAIDKEAAVKGFEQMEKEETVSNVVES